MSDSFFKSPESGENAILLVDASGSVLSMFHGTTIFQQFEQLIMNLPEFNFHIIFWNSDMSGCGFPHGIIKLPFIVTKTTLHQAFLMAQQKIDNSCLTFPHLGFENISDWLTEDFSRKVYYITDGQIGYGSISTYESQCLKNKF